MLIMPCYKFVSGINRHAVRHEVVRKLLTGYSSSPPTSILLALSEKIAKLKIIQVVGMRSYIIQINEN